MKKIEQYAPELDIGHYGNLNEKPTHWFFITLFRNKLHLGVKTTGLKVKSLKFMG